MFGKTDPLSGVFFFCGLLMVKMEFSQQQIYTTEVKHTVDGRNPAISM